MTAVVLDVAAAVAARRDRDTGTFKELRLAAGVVQQRVVGGVEPPLDGQQRLDVNGDPVPEHEPGVVQHVADRDVPLRQVVGPERAAWRYDPRALGYPLRAPVEVLGFLQVVPDASPVVLVQVERRVREHQVTGLIWHLCHEVKAVAVVQRPVLGGVRLREFRGGHACPPWLLR